MAHFPNANTVSVSILLSACMPIACSPTQPNRTESRSQAEMQADLAQVQFKIADNNRTLFELYMKRLRMGDDPGPPEVLLGIGIPYVPYVELYAIERNARITAGTLKPSEKQD